MFTLKRPSYSVAPVSALIIAVTHFPPALGTAQVPESPAIPIQPPSSSSALSSSSAQPSPLDSARRQPSYQVFAHQIALPSITATNDVLVIGTARLDLARRDQMLNQLKPLSEQLGMPSSVLEAFLKRLKTNGQLSEESAANQLRVSVIDYKYLLQRWTQYHPPAGEETVKTNALQLLQAGDLEQVWRLFSSLPRPAPPGGLRIVKSGT